MKNNKIYDFEPFDKPDKAGYYQLRAVAAFQTRNGAGMSINRAVSVEHILEWQVLLDFIRADEARCRHIADKFNVLVDIDTTLDVINDAGKSVPTRKIRRETAIEWVAHQYPGTAFDKSDFSYEFVSLHDGVNGRKERVGHS